MQNKDDGTDLYLYLPKDDVNSEPILTLAETKKSVVYSGTMWGKLPWLEVNGKGSLFIKSGNETIGRDRWTQTLLVVYRNKEFPIAGIAYTARDTLDARRLVVCDVNFLTGKGLRNSTPIPAMVKPIKTESFNDI